MKRRKPRAPSTREAVAEELPLVVAADVIAPVLLELFVRERAERAEAAGEPRTL